MTQTIQDIIPSQLDELGAGRRSPSSRPQSCSDSGAPPLTTLPDVASYRPGRLGRRLLVPVPSTSRVAGRTPGRLIGSLMTAISTSVSAPTVTARKPSGGTSFSTSAMARTAGDGRSGTVGFGPAGKPRPLGPSSWTNVNNGAYVIPARTTLADWIRDSWLPMTEPRVKPTTFHSYKRNLGFHVIPVLGHEAAAADHAPMLDRTLWPTGRRWHLEGAEGAQRQDDQLHPLDVAQGPLGRGQLGAARQERGGSSQAAPAEPPGSRAASRSWEPMKLAGFLQAVRGTRLEAIWRLSAMTGMRRGEILGLRWCDLDLGSGSVVGPPSARRRWLQRRPLDAEEPSAPA